MSRYEDFQAILESAKADFEKFYDKGNAAAGTRVRKALQDIANLSKEVRKEVTEIKNDRKDAKSA